MKFISKITLIFLIVFSSSSLMAQLSIGGRVGANFANVNVKSDGLEISPSSITGLVIAVPFDIAISENFSVQPELMFIQKGFEVSFDFFGSAIKGMDVINYIDVPILAKYTFVNTESIAVYLAGGPVLGYAMSGKTTTEENGDKTSESIDFDESQYNRFEFSVSIGAGAGFVVGPGQIVLDLRFVPGLSNLNGDSDTNSSDKIMNTGFQVGVGYMVPIGQ